MPTYDIQDLLRKNLSIVEIARRFGVKRNFIYDLLHQIGIEDIRKFRREVKFDQSFFQKVDTEEKAYWLGFLYADGCVYIKEPVYRIQIHLGKSDIEHLRKWHRSIGSCQNVTQCGAMVNSAHHSQQMCSDLIAHGCHPRKSLNLRFPPIRDDLLRHFIRGYFDGDGTIYWHHNRGTQRYGGMRISIIGTFEFLRGIQKSICRILGISPTRLHHPSRKNTYVLSVGGYTKAKIIAGWMYEDSTIFLDRKYRKYLQFKLRMER